MTPRELITKWRERMKDAARYGVAQALTSPREYFGSVNAALAISECVDELEAALRSGAPTPPTKQATEWRIVKCDKCNSCHWGEIGSIHADGVCGGTFAETNTLTIPAVSALGSRSETPQPPSRVTRYGITKTERAGTFVVNFNDVEVTLTPAQSLDLIAMLAGYLSVIRPLGDYSAVQLESPASQTPTEKS